MTISPWLDSQTEKIQEEYDLIIVGAGITGSAAAYWLSRLRDLKVAIVESSHAASGASGRNGGFVLRGVMGYYSQIAKEHGRSKARAIFQLNEESQAQLAEFARTDGDKFFYSRCGSYRLASSIEELQDLSESYELMKEDGFELEFMREDPLDRGYYGALHYAGDIAVNPAALTRALLASSKIPVYENEQVYDIDWANNQALLRTNKKILSASRVLICTNAYLPLLVPELLKHLHPVRGQVIATRPLKETVVEKLCYANFGYEYFRQLPDGRFLLGGCREPFIQEEVGYADMISSNVQTALQNYLKDRFPEIAGARIDYRWSGVMSFTRDGLPIMGELNDKPGVFYLSGCNGHGLGYAFALSKLLIEFALDGAKPGIFDARRLLNPESIEVGSNSANQRK